nr:putative integron gene cassette protein [uncultured bacterium]
MSGLAFRASLRPTLNSGVPVSQRRPSLRGASSCYSQSPIWEIVSQGRLSAIFQSPPDNPDNGSHRLPPLNQALPTLHLGFVRRYLRASCNSQNNQLCSV